VDLKRGIAKAEFLHGAPHFVLAADQDRLAVARILELDRSANHTIVHALRGHHALRFRADLIMN